MYFAFHKAPFPVEFCDKAVAIAGKLSGEKCFFALNGGLSARMVKNLLHKKSVFRHHLLLQRPAGIILKGKYRAGHLGGGKKAYQYGGWTVQLNTVRSLLFFFAGKEKLTVCQKEDTGTGYCNGNFFPEREGFRSGFAGSAASPYRVVFGKVAGSDFYGEGFSYNGKVDSVGKSLRLDRKSVV